jgi:flagellar protein FliO/FliZ
MLPLIGRLVLSLGVVVGLMVVLGRFMHKRGLTGLLGGSGAAKLARIEVIGRHQFGRNSSVAIVRAGGKALVLGVTEQSINLLSEFDETALLASMEFENPTGPEANRMASQGGARPGPTWRAFIENTRERTVRR